MSKGCLKLSICNAKSGNKKVELKDTNDPMIFGVNNSDRKREHIAGGANFYCPVKSFNLAWAKWARAAGNILKAAGEDYLKAGCQTW